MGRKISAIVFDKDGTLLDFQPTFAAWAREMAESLASGDRRARDMIAGAIGYDLSAGAFRPDSVAIAGTNRDIANAISNVLEGRSAADLEAELVAASGRIAPVPLVPLAPLLDGLARRGIALGVMTNDGESPAREQLARAGIADRFGAILGADSGYGGKPDPDPLLAACAALGADPAEAAMVGDSAHDLEAGRRAGMATVAVLSGPGSGDGLARLADAILPDVGHLPGWLDREGRG